MGGLFFAPVGKKLKKTRGLSCVGLMYQARAPVCPAQPARTVCFGCRAVEGCFFVLRPHLVCFRVWTPGVLCLESISLHTPFPSVSVSLFLSLSLSLSLSRRLTMITIIMAMIVVVIVMICVVFVDHGVNDAGDA